MAQRDPTQAVDAETMLQVAELRRRGMSDDEIRQMITAHPEHSEILAPYKMSEYTHKGATESVARTPWGAAANVISGLHAKRAEDRYRADMKAMRDIITGKRQISMDKSAPLSTDTPPSGRPTMGQATAGAEAGPPEAAAQGAPEQNFAPAEGGAETFPLPDQPMMEGEMLPEDEEFLMDEEMLDPDMFEGMRGGGGY